MSEGLKVSICKGGCPPWKGWLDECPGCGADTRQTSVVDPTDGSVVEAPR